MDAILGLFASLAFMAILVILLYTAIEAFGRWLVTKHGGKEKQHDTHR